MIGPNSILRRLPPQLDRKQMLFFDGIRHAVEIIQFAHLRLRQTLTDLAINYQNKPLANDSFTIAFLDAWAIVDAIDRFRAFWELMPNVKRKAGQLPGDTFSILSQPIRDLRNVADHLAQRAEYVIAQKGTALGVLSWYTALNIQGTEGISCILLPGTYAPIEREFVNPAEKTSTYPTGLINLAAGGYREGLADLFPEIEKRIRFLESTLEEGIVNQGLSGQQAGADVMFSMHLRAVSDELSQNLQPPQTE